MSHSDEYRKLVYELDSILNEQVGQVYIVDLILPNGEIKRGETGIPNEVTEKGDYYILKYLKEKASAYGAKVKTYKRKMIF